MLLLNLFSVFSQNWVTQNLHSTPLRNGIGDGGGGGG